MPYPDGYYWIKERGNLLRVAYHEGDQWFVYGDPADEHGLPLTEERLEVMKGPLPAPAIAQSGDRPTKRPRRKRRPEHDEDYFWVQVKRDGRIMVVCDTGEGFIDIADFYDDVLPPGSLVFLEGPLEPFP